MEGFIKWFSLAYYRDENTDGNNHSRKYHTSPVNYPSYNTPQIDDTFVIKPK